MKKIVLIFSLVFSIVAVSAQTAERWHQIYGGTDVDAGYGVRSCLDQGYLVVGVSSSLGPSDGYIVRTDSLGLVMWSKWYGGTNVDVFRAVEIMPDSGFIVAGYTNSNGHGGYDAWLVRIDKNGDTLWTRTVGTNDWDFFYDVERTRDGGFLCVGGTYGAGAGDEDIFLVRFDSNGDTLWTKTYGGTRTDEGRAVVETEDSLIAISGFTHSLSDTLGDSWLLRLEENGDIIWTRTLGDSTAEDKAYGLTYDSIFDIILYCGYSMETNLGEGYWEGVYYDDTVWFTFYGVGPGAFDVFYAMRSKVLLDPIALAGTTFSQGGGQGDMWFFGTGQTWVTTTYGTIYQDQAYDIDFARDGGYILCGITYGFNSFAGNLYLVKVDSNAYSPTVLTVPEISESGIKTAMSAFPVPADDQVSFSMVSDFNDRTDLALAIYNSTGQVVQTISSGEFLFADKNHASVRLNTSQLPQGIYFYVLHNEEEALYSDNFIISR